MTWHLRVLGCTAATVVCAGALWLSRPLPPALLQPPAAPGLRIEDRFGATLRSTRAEDGSLRRWVPLAAIDPDLVAAFIAVEDRRFRRHWGVDLTSVVRAGWQNIRARRVVSGASTISMQLARLLRPLPRTLPGKVAQMFWAVRLELHLGKEAILEQYVNRVPLGQGAVGVDAAARLYLGASASEVSVGEAALLAGLAHAPSRDNPLTAPNGAARRRSEVLRRLVNGGYITSTEAERAQAEPLLGARAQTPFLAPHFTTQIAARTEREGLPQGAIWRTSLDAQLQATLEADVRHTVYALRERGGRNAAVVVLDNPTGQILAWVGSADFWADSAGQVDMVSSPRQPGSALKPFVYGLAFDRGYTTASILPDIARSYAASTGTYAPRNYDRRFHGPVRTREALASSFNVPAVELAHRLGVAPVLATLRRAGFESLRASAEYYGLGLALGNGDVTLLEMANAYRALAEGGKWSPVQWSVGSSAGQTGTAETDRRQVMSRQSAALLLDVLSDADARIPGFGLGTSLDFPFPVAAKTGTSRHFTDNWAVAVTGRFTVAVWVGDAIGRPMQGVSGVSGAGPLLHRAVLATAARYEPGRLPLPAEAGLVGARICRTSGMLATSRCPDAVEWFMPGTAPIHQCAWHGAAGLTLPTEYATWAAQQGPTAAAPALPRIASDSREEGIRIVSPQAGDRYRIPPGVDARYATLALVAAGTNDGPVRWVLDGKPLRGARLVLEPGRHRVRAVAGAHSDEVTFVVE